MAAESLEDAIGIGIWISKKKESYIESRAFLDGVIYALLKIMPWVPGSPELDIGKWNMCINRFHGALGYMKAGTRYEDTDG